MILVAPDKFKGTLSAAEVAEAIAAGIRAAGGEARELAVADGGEGTAHALMAALGGQVWRAPASDPLGRPIEADFAMLGDGETAAVDAAAASGLALLGDDELDPWDASSAGTGELILAALDAGARRVIVGAGGTATVDGGLGAVKAIGAAAKVPRLVVACDARTPWERAAEIYGPQKGADADMVKKLAWRMNELAVAAPRDPRGVELTGCAGGLSGALWAHFGAELVPGAAYVLDTIGFDGLATGATSVVTGEGRLDEQTFEGKTVATVAARAATHGIPCDAVVGTTALVPADQDRLGLRRVLTASTKEDLRAAGKALAQN